MIQFDASQLPPAMKSPGEILQDLLTRNRIEKTALGKLLGVNYNTVNRWTKNEHFGPDKQREVLDALRAARDAGKFQISEELSPNYFSEQTERLRRAHKSHRAAVIELFATSTKVGASITREERERLERLDLSFQLDVPLCEALTLASRGKITNPVAAADHQRRLIRSAKRKKSTSDHD